MNDKQFLDSFKIRCYPSGALVDPFDLQPYDIDIRDIAHHLSLECRFGGAIEEHWSVAKHSLLACYMVEEEFRAWTLLHDAAETYFKDMPRPLKRRPEMKFYADGELEGLRRITSKYGLGWPMPPEVKAADDKACLLEKFILQDRMIGLAPFDGYDGKLALHFDHLSAMSDMEIEGLFLEVFTTYCQKG